MSMDMDRKVVRPRWRRRPVILGGAAAVVAAALAVAGVGLLGGQRTLRVAASAVTIDTAQPGVFHDFTALRGKVAPHDIVYLDAQEGGQVEAVLAHAGDRVVLGQPLVRFRNTELELDVLDRVGRLVESITQLQAYEKQLEDSRLANAKAEVEIDYNIIRLSRAAARRGGLAATGYVPVETTDQLRDELAYNTRLRPLQLQSDARQDALRREQLPEVHAELANLRQSLAITRSKLDNLVVRAPIAGQLTDIIQNVGENRNRGERLGQIAPDTGVKVTASIDEFFLPRVRVGQLADIDFADRSWKLRVERVYPQVAGGVFTVDLDFDGPAPAGLLPGQAVDGKLSLGGDQPALILPAGAFLERTGGDWVLVVDAGGRHAERRRVRIGRRNAEQVEVLSGLKPGERVITSDYTGFEKIDRLNISQ